MIDLNWKPFIYGGMASIVAEFGTFPIDLTKTRLQVQGQCQYTEVRYRGMFHALFKIGKEEGIRALYSGISPALLRQASYGTIKIGTYNSLKRLFVTNPEDQNAGAGQFAPRQHDVQLHEHLPDRGHQRAVEGCHPHSTASSHCGRGGTSCLRHHEEAPPSIRTNGRHHYDAFHFEFHVRLGRGAGVQPRGRGAHPYDEPAGFVGGPHVQRNPGRADADVEERGLLRSL
uniref:Uncharacterized protein n=1 Tax=Gasterosteus aculeatus aculeatus TaxID=481459 RepID=G3QCC6_GASAC